jgi:hypothetical protein
VTGPAARKGSLPLLLIVCYVPLVAAGVAGAWAFGGSKAIMFGAALVPSSEPSLCALPCFSAGIRTGGK